MTGIDGASLWGAAMRYMRFLLLGLLAALLLVVAGEAQPAYALTITVTTTADEFGTGSDCSLREAIVAANIDVAFGGCTAGSGGDTIAFGIPGTGPHTIQPTSPLPFITDPLIIDGYTQAGASLNTDTSGLSNAVLQIELDGSLAGFASGLLLSAGSGGSVVRGLVINRFFANGIQSFSNSGGGIIEGNFIGTDVDGAAALGNRVGVSIATPNNTIGGTAPGARNVISGNDTRGVEFGDSGATGNQVQGNLIGTDVTGAAALGNGAGVAIAGASNNTVGGTTAGARNVISANFQGVFIIQGATGNLVQGNFIGTDVAGTGALGNSVNGVNIAFGASSTNTIGGTASGAGNIIAFNGGAGIVVGDPIFTPGTGNAILSNSIFSNTGLGIDLFPSGVTPNDVGDGDTGPNNLQNFPVLTSATSSPTTTNIAGTLNSTAITTFALEFFSNTACDPSNHGEGETFLGSTMATTGGTGNASFSATFGTPVPSGQFITATATDPNDNTSEFSQCEQVNACAGLAATIVGTDASEAITGTPGDDVIHGLGGNDRIRGQGGDDVICGGDGGDRLIGGPGDDTLNGDAGRDTLIGSKENDILNGGDGNDLLMGQMGDDAMDGGAGTDICNGGSHVVEDTAVINTCELIFGVP